ncbi:MAG: DMT family transporter [Bdellovibrionales bacterium]|nr:DMT family transporter [Bdellovibrionales bacterium]
MIWILIAVLGFLAVVQGGMNRMIGKDWGLPGAVFLNAIMFLTASAAFYIWVLRAPQAPPLFQSHQPFQNFKFWYFLSGIFGFVFVLGVPIAIAKVGATLTFVGLVVAQIAAGATWDYFIEGRFVTTQKALGISIALLGVWMATREQ